MVLRLVRAVCLAGATAVVALAQLHLPSERFWDGHAVVQWISVALLALFILTEGVQSVAFVVQAARIREYDNDVRTALTALLAGVVEKTGPRWDEVAVRYYRHRGVWWWRRLVVVTALQAAARVVDPRDSVRIGAGVVGVAVATQEIIAAPWRQFVLEATRQGRQAWEARTAVQRYGLRWGELRRSAKPEGVVACPTFDGRGRVDGCIVLSGPLTMPELTGEQVLTVLDDAATALDKAGPPPRGWWTAHA